MRREVEEAGRTIGQKIVLVNAGNEREFDAAFTSIVQAGARAIVVTGSFGWGSGPFGGPYYNGPRGYNRWPSGYSRW